MRCVSDKFARKAMCLDVHAACFTVSFRFIISILRGKISNVKTHMLILNVNEIPSRVKVDLCKHCT